MQAVPLRPTCRPNPLEVFLPLLWTSKSWISCGGSSLHVGGMDQLSQRDQMQVVQALNEMQMQEPGEIQKLGVSFSLSFFLKTTKRGGHAFATLTGFARSLDRRFWRLASWEAEVVHEIRPVSKVRHACAVGTPVPLFL